MDGQYIKHKRGGDSYVEYSNPPKRHKENQSPSQSSSHKRNAKESNKYSGSDRVDTLLQALNAVLDNDINEDISSLLGNDVMKKCASLRKRLQKSQEKPRNPELEQSADSSTPTPPSSSSGIAHKPNIPISIKSTSITPWTSKSIPKSLPPLPPILDPTLETATFIHQGYTSGHISNLSYERLEWVGDAYLYLTATLLIAQTFPSLLPGKCAQLRERVVKNITLADYARQYGFQKRARLPDVHTSMHKVNTSKESDRVKILGDIFEAYIAGVILSDPENGVRRCSDWLKDLLGMTLREDIEREERRGAKFDSPLWRLRGDSEPVKIIASKEDVRSGAKEQLRKLIGCKGVSLTYKDAAPEKKDPMSKLPIFTVGVYFDGWGETSRLLGQGTGNGKKDAGEMAAEMAMRNKKLIDGYVEKKKKCDEIAKMERDALEMNGGRKEGDKAEN